MNYQNLDKSKKEEVANLFTSVFTSSESEKEGVLVGGLSSELASNIDNKETICFGACENGSLIGAIFFTRLKFNDPIQVYMLAPVAVSTEFQGRGIGQKLINYGLNELRNRSVSIVVTYGDPSFYSKIGFQSLSEDLIQAPLKLSMPIGWLGQTLTGEPIPSIKERPVCVKEFNNPVYW
ncbi:MAG: GNAT family N-acetyltransferase [Neptuniibacter sp.]